MDIDEEPAAKRSRMPDKDHCIICEEPLEGPSRRGPAVKNPTQSGLQSLLDAAKKRSDKVYHQVWPIKYDILQFKCKVSYHKSCRAAYTSKSNFPSMEKEESQASTSDDPQTKRLTRGDTSIFSIREQCFICVTAEKRMADKSRERLTPISTGTGKSTRKRVMEAAERRKDTTVHIRMLAHHDLFAFDAKYHRSCYSHYISERNIQASSTDKQEKEPTVHDKAFHHLVKEIEETVLSRNAKRVVTLSSQRDRIITLMIDMGIPEDEARQYSGWKLKARLEGHFQDRLSFFERPGHTDLMCSSTVTVGDALRKALELRQEDEDEVEDYTNFSENPGATDASGHAMEEARVLHIAAGILREKMTHIKGCSDAYIPATEVEVQKCRRYVPDELYDFVLWCTSDDDYQNVSSSKDTLPKDVDLRVLTVCHNIIGLTQKVQTPLALALGVHVHHEVGSKQLIEVLHSLGHSVSYDEVRRFLTSVAKDHISQAKDVYMPQGLKKFDRNDISTMIDAAIDNFDQNENTLDGKTTTHAMATVLYQQRVFLGDDDGGIPRSQQRALDVTEYTEEPISRYAKPHQMPEPPSMANSSFLDVDEHVTAKSKERDLVWELASFLDSGTEAKNIPGWSGFNAMTAVEKVPPTIIRYLPFLSAPPTDLSTIYTTLTKLVAVAEKHGQMHIVVTADLAIYMKALQIIWSKPKPLAGKVTMRLGGMHHLMAFIASIGKLFGDGGLLQLLTVTGVYAEATARQMLQGKQLARAVRGIKLVLQALSYARLKSAHAWADEQGIPWTNDQTSQGLEDLQTTFRMKDRYSCLDIIDSLNTSGVAEALKQFQVVGRSQSATFRFWDDYMEAAHIMLRLLRAERDADFDLHLEAVCETVPYFIVGGRHNYAKYTPVYVAEMRRLEVEHPDIHRHLCNGGFVVRRSSKHLFNCVPTDQALEQTVNREAKSQGGVIGFTLRKGALLRWLLTRHVTGSYSEAMKVMCIIEEGNQDVHGELGRSRVTRDTSDVQKITDALENQYQNPFDLVTVPSALINIVTGQMASKEVEDCLATMNDVGKRKMMEFTEKRLLEGSSTSFWAPQQKVKMKTFADMRKPLPGDKHKKFMVSTEVLFRRLLAVSKLRDIDLKSVLRHELASVPPALFSDDGSMRKTNKSDLAKKLESVCDEVHVLPAVTQEADNTAYIIDGTAVLQSLNETLFKTFEDLAEQIMKKILRLLHTGDLHVDCVTLVFDRYKTDSIKAMERERRGAGETTPSHQVTSSRDVPNYRTFLKGSANKAALAQFVCESITAKAPDRLQQNKSIVLAGGFAEGQTVKSVTNHGTATLQHMFSNHEEADTRMVLHAIELSKTHSRVSLRCDDTDVLVILLYYYSRGLLAEEVYMHAGHSGKVTTRERYIPVHTVAERLGTRVCACLPAVHALTGCDTTSAFFRIGKRTAFTKLVDNVDAVHALSQFGVSSALTVTLNSARSFVLLLYGTRGKQCSTLDELRYVLATSTDKDAAMLPPTEDAFRQHVLRAKLQASIWCHSHEANPELDDPVGHGWAVGEDGLLEHKMYEKDCAPIELRDVTHLYCNDKNCNLSQKCPCLMAGLPCIETCSCSDCPNTPTPTCEESDDDE